MIRHKTVTNDVGAAGELFSYLFGKIDIVLIIEEYLLLVIAAIVDVVKFILYNMHELYESGR
jgi:hypothetical protein